MTAPHIMAEVRLEPTAAPWHHESYERFLVSGLPELLAARLTLEGYQIEAPEEAVIRLTITVGGLPEPVALTYFMPQCSEEGWFMIPALRDTPGGERRVVVPRATTEDLETAQIACVGEQLETLFRDQLAPLPDHLGRLLGTTSSQPEERATRLRDWLPFDQWMLDFFARAQMVDPTNYLATHTHLRRIFVEGEVSGWHLSQIGRVCPLETPEGPNLGRVLTVARGATIRNGKLVIIDARPEQSLGLCGGLIPFVHYSEPARTLMGANMMRQWHPLPNAEPPLVRTGMEPGGEPTGLWCGVNLLTAFVFWGIDTHEDALVISESAARRLGFPYPLEAGDKLSNRHGAKGVVGRILPDAEMPHLPDGTPVDITYTFFGLTSRMNHGQLLEAALGLVAKAEGQPAVASPFEGPSREEVQARLDAAGLPTSGMMGLTEGKGGTPLERDSSVGYVYWGRTAHDARTKLSPSDREPLTPGQRLRTDEYRLRDVNAWNLLHSLYVVQDAARPEADRFAATVASGVDLNPTGEAPRFNALRERLASLGIDAHYVDGAVRFAFTEITSGEALEMPVSLPHPWASERKLTAITAVPMVRETAEWGTVRDAVERLRRMSVSAAPPSLQAAGIDGLRQQVRAFGDAVIAAEHFLPDVRSLFSGRAVIAPGDLFAWDEIGVPEAMAWQLFGPLLVRHGEATTEAVAARTPDAFRALDTRLARMWVLINRQPTLYSTSIIAFRPRRIPGNVLRLHPLVCPWLEADFDGDQLAVFLPLTDAAQREAAELLSVRGHLLRDPSLLSRPYAGLISGHGMLYGLAEKSRTEAGRREMEAILGRALTYPAGILERSTLVETLAAILREESVDSALARLAKLSSYGFAASKRSGASLGPFLGDAPAMPSPPRTNDAPDWEAWGDECVEHLAVAVRAGAFAGSETGPALLSAASGARGRLLFLAKLLVSVAPGTEPDAAGIPMPMRHGWRDGLTPEELYAVVANTRLALMTVLRDQVWLPEEPGTAPARMAEAAPRGNGVIARALRSRRPGIVFAQAAQSGETDLLRDPDTRLLLGLPPQD